MLRIVSLICPADRIVWDVGHQAYVHKILTGRGGEFSRLRQYGGLSGFPRPAESLLRLLRGRAQQYLPLGSAGDGPRQGFAGKGLSGCRCDRRRRDDRRVAYEALNDAGRKKQRLIVILNE